MMNIPLKKAIPDEIKNLLLSADKKCYVVIPREKRVYTSASETEYASLAYISEENDSLFISLYKEKCAAGALVTKEMWQGGNVCFLIICGSLAYCIKASPYKCHTTGDVFAKKLSYIRSSYTASDISAVWEMYFDSFEKLKNIPDGNYTKEEADFFEMHYDNPSVMKTRLTGCRFSIAPMSDDFENIILGAIEKTDTSHVLSFTDEFSTVYKGCLTSVTDALKACFIYAYKKDVHMTMTGIITNGCPCKKEDTPQDFAAYSGIPANESKIKNIHFGAAAKIELYPLGSPDYLSHIEKIIELAKKCGVFSRSSAYTTILKADIQELFGFLKAAASYCEQNLDHYVLGFTFGVNFPED